MCAQDLSATDPAALGLRHSLHAQSSACIEKVDSVGIMQLSSHPDPVGKLQDAGCKDSELPENPSQEGLEPLELARRESQRAHACTLEEKGLPPSALLTTRKSLETQEQQEMQSELETLETMPSAHSNGAVHRELELRAEAGADTEITARQTFAKQDVNAPARGRDTKTCPLSTAARAVCARHTSEQSSPPETETVSLPAPPALNRRVRGLEVAPDREVQVCIANSMHTIDGEQTAPTTHDSSTPKPLSCGEADQDSASRRFKNGCRTINHSISPVIDGVDMSPTSSSRGPRSTLEGADQFPDELAVALRPLLEPSPTASCGGSPIYQKGLRSMEFAPQHIQPPVDYRRYIQQWTTRSYEPPQGDIQLLQHRDTIPMSPTHSNTALLSELHIPMHRTDWSSVEQAIAIKPMHYAVCDERRRKKPFMKRAKTGCGTCRRRKKKCDEAKPECNNCTRIGIICQGYVDKMTVRKNRISTSLPSSSDQTRMPMEARQPQSEPRSYDLRYIINSEPGLCSSQSIHQYPHASVQSADTVDGGDTIDERRYQTPASSGGTVRHDLSHVSYQKEQSYPPAHRPRSPLAPVSVHERDVSNEDRQVTHPVQTLPFLYHNPRVYNQTPQRMDRGTPNPSAVAFEAHQQRAQSSRFSLPVIPTAAPPKPSLSWHKQAPSLLKTEKQKMLDGEPFMPYCTQLVDDRRQCAVVLYRFNNTIDAVPEVVQRMRERYFRAIIEAAWTQPRCGDGPVGCRLGSSAHVATPFHCDYGYNVSVGDNVIIGPNSRLLDSARIAIGRNTRIGACVTITTLKAPTDIKALKRSYGLEVAKDIYIGENVYIGDCCVVGAGVRVGYGAIVRPGSVVVHDIPPDYIAYGNPANVYKAS
jgi:acetyltransferase-like isoleucine patch superfamily enzyme